MVTGSDAVSISFPTNTGLTFSAVLNPPSFPSTFTALCEPQTPMCKNVVLSPHSPESASAASTPENHSERRSAFSEERRRVWVHGPRPEYRRESQRVNLPSRIIPLLRPNLDIVILPGNHAPTREFWEFCREVLGLQEWQALFTSGTIYNMDDDVDDAMIATLRDRMSASRSPWTLVPYCVTPNFQRWAAKLAAAVGGGVDGREDDHDRIDIETFGEDLAWVEQYGHKGALHRHMRSLDEPSLIERIDPTIRVAAGYTCSTAADLLAAHALLGGGRAVVKPIYGAAGEGILFVDSAAELAAYTFPMGDVCLEEHLTIDLAADGVVLSPAMHYMEGELVGGGDLVDQIMEGTTYMGWRRSAVGPEFEAAARAALGGFVARTRPAGPGGVDFLSVGGQPILSDLNTGRFNGCHGPKLFRIAYAPGSHLFVWKGQAPPDLTVQAFWAECVAAGCAFTPGVSTEGVFPLLYLRSQ